MRSPSEIPLIVRGVSLFGPKGSVSVDLILDTGSVLTALSWSDLKLLGYDPVAALERQEIVTANGVIEVPKLQVQKINVGKNQAVAVDVICHDIPELAGLRGLLGLSFLKYFKTVIDYKQGYFEIS